MPLEAVKRQSVDLYRKMNCRYCRTPLPEPFLDLGVMPLANSFLTPDESRREEFCCPLRLAWCASCGLVQLSDVVPADRMFGNYLYVSSTTETFRKHFAEYARVARAKLGRTDKTPLAVDIGSNDGLLVSCYESEGMRAAGIEPAKNLVEEASRHGLKTYLGYLNARIVDAILKDLGPAHLVSGNNVFAHIDDIHDALQNIVRLLDRQGIFIIEFPYLVTMCEQMLFDMIYHEHLSYIAAAPLQKLLAAYHLEIFDIQFVPSHGGSLRVFIQKTGGGRVPSGEVDKFLRQESEKGYASAEVYHRFAEQVKQVKEELIRFVKQIKTEGKSISGYGAPAKGNTLINYCDLTASQIDYIVDDNPLKQNLLTPGAKIPVVPSSRLLANPTDYVLIFAWNFSDEIMKKLEPLKQKGVRFIIPLPRPRVL